MVNEVPGGWFVDGRCINCDASRQIAPNLIVERNGRSAISWQPQDETEIDLLHAAAYACPTRSIRPPSGRLNHARDPFPLRLDEDLYLCGHNSPHTAGANSFLLVRHDRVLMVDTPRWSESLAARFETYGNVTDILLTHIDHAAHGRRYADRFGASLWMHEGDATSAVGADKVLRGLDSTEIVDGVIAYPIPGHTEGSVLYVADERYCFTGDSLYWSRATSDIEIFQNVVWYSLPELATSLERLVGQLRFEWILPGHGDRKRLPAEEMSRRMHALTARVQALQPQPPDLSATRW
ncbi:ferredoxin [Allokutzneria sp. A3M-2-11 16]|uniref:4Fe-4S domain-containing protein n=1 Tax=Allokutzneria sp. A3M-2-11 16 TaxID=2962043 RepID=UPI0020B88175|nr:ferredoxin [Allokutzneria sp. A3M-2-11 16]MCP3802014.1 ferredoxin [Allokutzneria sp. A3M-2-11 16]